MRQGAVIVLEISRLEAAHLGDLLTQFTALLSDTAAGGSAAADPAVARLVPDAYADDAEASREFRGVTEHELLERRLADARTVLETLATDDGNPDPAALGARAAEVVPVILDADAVRAWLRSLAALRLVLASRLGIRTEDDHHHNDPRFGIYDWLGYRLDGLIRAADSA